MNQHRARLFDAWAEIYDQFMQDDGSFPFDGYERVLDAVAQAAGAREGMSVLDLGIGTGNLASRFSALDCDLWGVDFSAKMLAKAGEKLPQVRLVQVDLLADWPPELDRRFDRIVSAYVMHHFDLATKAGLLQRLAARHLEAGGRIVVGDIAYPTSEARDQAHIKWAHSWDEDEYYWAADETADACQRAGLQVRYEQISSCGGVFVVEDVSDRSRVR